MAVAADDPAPLGGAAFAVCALYAGGVALFSTNDLHRIWGTAAAVGYLLAAWPRGPGGRGG